MENLIPILLFIVGLFVGTGATILFVYMKGVTIAKKAKEDLEHARKDAEKAKRDALLEAKEEIHKLKIETDREIKEKKSELKSAEDKLLQREKSLDRRDDNLSNREKLFDEKEQNLAQEKNEIQEEKVKLEDLKKEQITLLEKISGFSKEKAKEEIMKKIEEQMAVEVAEYIKDRTDEAKLEADKKAKNLLVLSMQKYAGDVTNEQTISVVNLPNDDMKGRLIGREGRNIRTIEAVTGVDLIIDDTPEAIVLSTFDPLRREIAKTTIEALIKDGRIHPARIEELYDKTCKEIKDKIRHFGEDATLELGLGKFDPELVTTIGKLHFRTSYGQNALQHSLEVAHLAGIMALELGENVTLAKRAGLLHDIGKAIDYEVEGSHVEIGVDLAKKYHEDKIVLNAIASHHGDTEATNMISVLVEIADTLSAARPGARNDSSENYIKRLEQLEAIANSYSGIEKAFAMQAGRELRVVVKPEMINDAQSYKVARDIKERIEAEMQYPGTVKVTVIRETRAVEEAK